MFMFLYLSSVSVSVLTMPILKEVTMFVIFTFVLTLLTRNCYHTLKLVERILSYYQVQMKLVYFVILNGYEMDNYRCNYVTPEPDLISNTCLIKTLHFCKLTLLVL